MARYVVSVLVDIDELPWNAEDSKGGAERVVSSLLKADPLVYSALEVIGSEIDDSEEE